MDGAALAAETAEEQPSWRRFLASPNAALLPLCLEPCLILLVGLLPDRRQDAGAFSWSIGQSAMVALAAGAILTALGYGEASLGTKPAKTALWRGALTAGLGCGLLASAVLMDPALWRSTVGFLLMLGIYAAVDVAAPADSPLRDLVKPLVMVPLVMGIFGSDLTQHVFFILLAYRALAGSLAIRGALDRTSDAMICRFLAVAMIPLIYIAAQNKGFGTPVESYQFVCLWVVVLAVTPFWKRVPWLLGLAEAGVVFNILKDWDYWMNVFTKGV